MKFPKTLASARGFTLIEAVIVVAILAIILAAGAPVGIGFYLDYQFDSEYETFFSLLQQARNLAMVNYNESDHGVYWNSEKYIVFQGTTFATRDTSQDRIFPRTGSVAITGPGELVFAALQGTTASTTYALTDSRKNRDLYVNSEGLVYAP